MNHRLSARHALAGAVAAICATLVMLAWTPEAHAYTWMIRHGYTSCAVCHADPSGGGLLTRYGRAQGALLLASRYDPSTDDEVVAKRGELLFGAVTLPDALLLGGAGRGMELYTSVEGQGEAKFILMTADVQADVTLGRVHADASLGFAKDGAFAASVVGDDEGRLVSRTHWLGFDFGADHDILLRAGRINLPFGVRTIEHTAWVRAATRTDNNAAQQHGLSLAFTSTKWRGEAMFIAGNYQVSPDSLRERGYSGFLEFAPSDRYTVGLSSLVTRVERDPLLQTPLWRQAHGLFARLSPKPWLVLLAEADALLYSQQIHNAVGAAGWLQADIEPVQGLHLIATLECEDRDMGSLGLSVGGWAGVAWFFVPHADVRVDAVVQSMAVPGAVVTAESVLAQLHFYL